LKKGKGMGDFLGKRGIPTFSSDILNLKNSFYVFWLEIGNSLLGVGYFNRFFEILIIEECPTRNVQQPPPSPCNISKHVLTSGQQPF
jgi:hypothetical protein